MNPYAKYRANVIRGLSQEQKVVMIFNEVINALQKAKNSIAAQDFASKNTHLQIASDALYALRLGTDIETSGEPAQYFAEFCDAVVSKIDAINIGSEASKELDNVIARLIQVKEAFTA